ENLHGLSTDHREQLQRPPPASGRPASGLSALGTWPPPIDPGRRRRAAGRRLAPSAAGLGRDHWRLLLRCSLAPYLLQLLHRQIVRDAESAGSLLYQLYPQSRASGQRRPCQAGAYALDAYATLGSA